MFTQEFNDFVRKNKESIASKRGFGRYVHAVNNFRTKALVVPNSRVLAIGPWVTELLPQLSPSEAVGIDPFASLSGVKPPPHIQVHKDPAVLTSLRGTFDYVIIPFSFGFMEDIHESLLDIRRFCGPDTRIIVTYYRKLWQPLVRLAEMLGIKARTSEMNWVPPKEIENLMTLADYQVIKDFTFCLMPVRIPFLSNFLNKYIGNLPFFDSLGVLSLVVGRPSQEAQARERKPPRVSVLVPARNEAGNVPVIVERIPKFPGGCEIIFVEGNSTDDTPQAIAKVVRDNPDLEIVSLTQKGKGKKDAVLTGFAVATGDILLILDADMTVPPESLPRFVGILEKGKAEFVNGTRLVYPMRGRAMRFINLMGNHFFSSCFSYLMDQQVRDTLCGTKVMYRKDFIRMQESFRYFGNMDPFGDFDFLFAATRLNLKIVDLPVRYVERVYGDTNINRWRDGSILLKMVVYGAFKLKFHWLPLWRWSRAENAPL